MATGIDVGAHLRAVRTMYGMSQRELAKRAGVTNGLISLIEQNRVSPSVSSLKKVLDGIPMSLAEFFTLDLSATPQVFFARDELTGLGDRNVSLRLVAARRPNRAMAIMHERYAPGADSRVLGPGDAYYFASAVPHRFRNSHKEACELISASTPPTF